MNSKLIKFLAGLSAFFVLIIIGEWLYSHNAQKQLLAEIETVDKKPRTLTQLPALELTRRPESSYVNMVNRPLFIQGRRPVNEAPQTVVAKSTASGTFNWSLNGIYTYKKALYALLSRNGAKVPKDNYRKVTKNSDIDGWVLDEIHKDKIVVSQGEQQKEIPLRKSRPKNVASNQNPTTPPVNSQPQNLPVTPGQMPPGTIPMPDQIPGGIPVPEQLPGGIPVPEAIPESIPEIMPEPEPPLEPEMIPDQPSEIYPENSENVQIQ